MYDFPIVFHGNYVFILHRFWDNITFFTSDPILNLFYAKMWVNLMT